MAKLYLIVNTGSASKKYALYSGGAELAKIHFENEGAGFVATYSSRGRERKLKIASANYAGSAAFFMNLLVKNKVLRGKSDIGTVGVRIVAPGTYFLKPQRITSEYLRRFRETQKIAPLHSAAILAELEALRKLFPGTPFVGISDSEFHSTMPDVAKQYAIPRAAREAGIIRYGYHGISMRFVADEMKRTLGDSPRRMIICHLGSGSSIGAILNGKSIDTSMGFTPLEGVPMATRTGDIGAGAVLELGKSLRLSPEKLDWYLNKQCGLLGLSGKTNDIRKLLELEKKGDKNARLALAHLVYHVRKYIGGYVAALGGLDALVFTATVGERSFILRSRICKDLTALGIVLDEKKNRASKSGVRFIGKSSARAKIAVVPTDEMREIFLETKRIA